MDVKKDSSKGFNILGLFGWKHAKRKQNSLSGDDKPATNCYEDNGIVTPSPRSANVIKEADSARSSSVMTDDRSCSSSMLDGVGKTGPGVVAKLMGLDSIPVATLAEPSSPMKVTSELSINSLARERAGNSTLSNQIDIMRRPMEGYHRTPMDLGPHKMAASRIERFQLEVVPPRNAKPFSAAHNKLVSPIRSSAYFSDRNAADIMEAASRIMEANFKAGSTVKLPSVQSSPSPIYIYKLNEMKVSKNAETAKRHGEPGGMASTGSSDYPVRTSGWRSVSVTAAGPPYSKPKVKGKTSSPQSGSDVSAADANRSSVTTNSGASSVLQSRSSTMKTEGKKMYEAGSSLPSSATPGSRVAGAEAIRSLSKGKTVPLSSRVPASVLVTKDPSNSSGERSRPPAVRARSNVAGKQSNGKLDERNSEGSPVSSSVQVKSNGPKTGGANCYGIRSAKPLKKPQMAANGSDNLVQANRRQNLDVAKHRLSRNDLMAGNGSGQRKLSSRKSYTPGGESLPTTSRRNAYAKGSPDKRIYSGKSRSSDDTDGKTAQKRIQHNVVIDEKSSRSQHNKGNNGEIVSFTFNLPGSRASYRADTQKDNGSSSSYSSNRCLPQVDFTDGSLLGILLEQKLNELTSGVRSPYYKLLQRDNMSITAPALQDTSSIEESSSMLSADYERESLSSGRDDPEGVSQASFTSENDQATIRGECRKDQKDPEQLSDLSISEALSNESFDLSESWKSSAGKESNSTEVTKSNSLHHSKISEDENDTVSSDTSSSMTVITAETPSSEIVRACYLNEYRQEQEFVRDLVNACSLSADVSSRGLAQCGKTLDSQMFENFYDRRRFTLQEESEKERKMRYKLLFECVSELLTAKFSAYYEAGYRSWTKGTVLLRQLSAAEVYREMNCCQVAEEGMVDELVEREMSKTASKWMHFDPEVFEAGVEIQIDILNSLIDETIDDLLTEN